MAEEMAAFFEKRLAGYDAHMLEEIAGAKEFYPFTAACLPMGEGICVLDLGCGTGLELEYYFPLNPAANITGIDLSAGMLHALREKFPQKSLTLLQGSYFDLPFGEACFDAAVSVESLHHFEKAEKIPLYKKLCRSLKQDGFFILTDYFALTDAEEREYRAQLEAVLKEETPQQGRFFHFDTPLTAAHETEVLLAGGFSHVEVLRNWGATYTLKATK